MKRHVTHLLALLLLMSLASAAPAATVEVVVSNFIFTPSTLTINTGDTVIFRNAAGFHNVVSDTGLFTSGSPASAPWTYQRTFNTVGSFPYYCAPHGGPGGVGQSAVINVVQAPSQFVINEGLQGAWFNSATSGQGYFFDIYPPSTTFVIAWFTWANTAGQYDWYSGQGTWTGARADVEIFRTRGGRFNNPTPVQTTSAGTASITFTSCSAATFTWNLTDPVSSGTIPLSRILPASQLCRTANPGTP